MHSLDCISNIFSYIRDSLIYLIQYTSNVKVILAQSKTSSLHFGHIQEII